MNLDPDLIVILFRLPTLLVYMLASIYALIQWQKDQRTACLIGGACILYILISLASHAATYIPLLGELGMALQFLAIGISEAICLLLLVIAIFLRKPA